MLRDSDGTLFGFRNATGYDRYWRVVGWAQDNKTPLYHSMHAVHKKTRVFIRTNCTISLACLAERDEEEIAPFVLKENVGQQ